MARKRWIKFPIKGVLAMSRRQVNAERKVFYLFSFATVIDLIFKRMERNLTKLPLSHSLAFYSYPSKYFLVKRFIRTLPILVKNRNCFSQPKTGQHQIHNTLRRFSQQHQLGLLLKTKTAASK